MNKVNLLIVEDDNNTVEEYKSDIKGFENFYIVGLSALQTTPQKP